jgi:hypothetical protein
MEPNLQDMSDYDKPLSFNKFLNIATFLLIFSSIYFGALVLFEGH